MIEIKEIVNDIYASESASRRSEIISEVEKVMQYLRFRKIWEHELVAETKGAISLMRFREKKKCMLNTVRADGFDDEIFFV